MKLKEIFSNIVETSDRASNQDLRTHYYNNDYEEVKYRITNYFKSINCTIESIDDNYKEILVSIPRGDLTVTLYQVSGRVTSVDILVSSNYFISFGRGIKFVKKTYEELNKRLTLKSIGGQAVNVY